MKLLFVIDSITVATLKMLGRFTFMYTLTLTEGERERYAYKYMQNDFDKIIHNCVD